MTMTTLPWNTVRDTLRDRRDEQRLFEAFVYGYFHGYQDHEADKRFATEDFEHRVEALFTEVQPRLVDDEVPGDG